jgi:xanthine dehydrogenase large subunit
VSFSDGHISSGGNIVLFAELVQKAYLARVQLWSDGFYATPDLYWDGKSMTGNPFSYYAYGAAVSEVVVDTLTGEWKLLRADVLYDAGHSLNPAIDKGQVEGAFIQGMGWLTTEELVWNANGKLTTHAPSTYKIPAISDCPEDFRVSLFKNKTSLTAYTDQKPLANHHCYCRFPYSLRYAMQLPASRIISDIRPYLRQQPVKPFCAQ